MFTGRKDKSEKMLTKLDQLKKEIADLADELAVEGKEVLRKKGFTDEQQTNFQELFRNCFVSTADTTTKLLENGETYVFTGDIEAMWLRDSSAQVVHYLPFAKKVESIRAMISGLIQRQMRYITIDPYANAFNEEENGHCWEKDDTDSNDWEWERKYEIDSLCYPIWLLHRYYETTKDEHIFSAQVKIAFRRILDTWSTEQHHDEASSYYFRRTNCPPTDTLSNDGKGEPTAYTGMTWSGFRPSDDSCQYGYLVPSNMFASVVLGYIAEYANSKYQDETMAKEAYMLKKQIEQGIEADAVRNLDGIGETYVYETDGYGNDVWMDDANVPSLIAMPYLGDMDVNDPIYQNTRRFVWSKDNPYFFKGKAGEGIGGPHIGYDMIWPMSIMMKAFTSKKDAEIKNCIKMLMDTDAGTGFMHESFHKDDPKNFTRAWFAWQNTLFGELILKLVNEGKTDLLNSIE